MFFVENKNHSENGSKTVFLVPSQPQKIYHLISSELLSYYCHHRCINNALAN